jgi:hypothetical protein
MANQELEIYGQPGSPPSAQSFDMSQALPALDLTVVGGDTATPTLSWNTSVPGATDFFVSASLRSSATPIGVFADNLSTTRTSITFPELPDSLAAFRPTGVDSFLVLFSTGTDGVLKVSEGMYYTFSSPPAGAFALNGSRARHL